MALDIASLVAPLGEDAPSGPDLGFDSARQTIESAFERSVSDGGSQGDEIDWRGTIRLIVDQAGKTRDLWLAVYLMRAAAQSGNFEMVVDGAEWMAQLLEQRWADLHPQLEEYEFIGRKTPCESLTKKGDFLNPLANVVVIEHPRLGRYSGADIQRIAEEGANAPNYGMFRALIEATDVEVLQAVVARFDQLRSAITRTDMVMTEHASGDTSTNFEPTYEQIDALRKAVASQIPGYEAPVEAAPAQQEVAGFAASGFAAPVADGPGFSGGIKSRDDVVKALDAIALYYSRYEPASPVPLALRRAKEWISLDFLTILEDIAPGSLDEAKRVLLSGRTQSNSAPAEWVDAPASPGGASADSGW